MTYRASYEAIALDRTGTDGSVAILTLNRPEHLNAWNDVMARELAEVLSALDEDDAVRVVVLTGAGRAFCAGADLGRGGATFAGRANQAPAEPAPSEPAAREAGSPTRQRMVPWMMRKPVIAAINGHAVGVGITYPLQCDVRYVAEDAKISFAFVRRGVLPELASHALLARVCGLSNAADLLLSGRMVTGREAAALGLATRALPAADVLPTAVAWADDVAVNTAPVSVAVAKRLLWQGITDSLEQMIAREDPLFGWLGRQPDAREGVMSFVERRPPRWSMSPTAGLPPGFP